MKKQKKFFAIGLAMLGGLVLAMSFLFFGLSNTMSELAVEIKKGDADVILANTEVINKEVVKVPVLYYDQSADECADFYGLGAIPKIEARQFEWTSCGFYNSSFETNLVEATLNDEYLPEASAGGGTLLANRGLKKGIKNWFSVVEEKNKVYAGTLALKYNTAESSFDYQNQSFFPLNEITIPEEAINADGNNHLFTMNLGIPIQVLANGKEEFEIIADDDTWVYLGKQLVLDMGGIHEPISGKIKITEDGKVYTEIRNDKNLVSDIILEKSEPMIMRIFHADRDSQKSEFSIKFKNMLLNIEDVVLASDEITVAYDPNNPAYVAPLGKSLSVSPDKSQAILVMATAEIGVLGTLAVLFILTISWVLKYSHRDRIPEE